MDNNKSRLAYSASICLTKKLDKKGNDAGLPQGIVATLKGKRCVVLPVDDCPYLYYNPKDNSVTLDLNIFENSNVSYEQTHHIRPSLGTSGKNMSDEQKRAYTPIIGNLKPFVPKGESQQAPAQQYGQAPQAMPHGGFPAYQQAPPPQTQFPPYTPQGVQQQAPAQGPQNPPVPPYDAYAQPQAAAPQAGASQVADDDLPW